MSICWMTGRPVCELAHLVAGLSVLTEHLLKQPCAGPVSGRGEAESMGKLRLAQILVKSTKKGRP